MSSSPNPPTCVDCGDALAPGGTTARCPQCQLWIDVHGADTTLVSTSRPALAAPDSASPRVGQSLGPFLLVARLGEGGMGVVFRGRDSRLGRDCAIKVLGPWLGADPALSHRFAAEARLVAKLNHPNIVHLYTFDQDAGRLFFAMELVEGQNLDQVLRQKRSLPERPALLLMRQAAAGLAHACQQGVIHRDIKPGNLMLTRKGVLKITDFGLAKSLASASAGAIASARVTTAGVVLGTPHFMSPEQAQGMAIDHRSDIYSLGASFFCLLTGVPPFNAETTMAVLISHVRDPAPGVARIRPDVSPLTADLIARCLAKDPNQRPKTYEELIDRIDQALKDIAGRARSLDPANAGPQTIRAQTIPDELIQAQAFEARPDSPAASAGLDRSMDARPGPKRNGSRGTGIAVAAGGLLLVMIISAIWLWHANSLEDAPAARITPGDQPSGALAAAGSPPQRVVSSPPMAVVAPPSPQSQPTAAPTRASNLSVSLVPAVAPGFPASAASAPAARAEPGAPVDAAAPVVLDLSSACNADIIITPQHQPADAFEITGGRNWASRAWLQLHGRNNATIGIPDDGRLEVRTPQFHSVFRIILPPAPKNAVLLTGPQGRQPRSIRFDLPSQEQRSYRRLDVLHGATWGDGVIALTIHYDHGQDEAHAVQALDWNYQTRAQHMDPGEVQALVTGALVDHPADMFAQGVAADPTRKVVGLTFSVQSHSPPRALDVNQARTNFTAAIFAITGVP